MIIKSTLYRIFTALLCVLLLAGCGAKPSVPDDTSQGGQGQLDINTHAKPRQILTNPQITPSINWAEGESGDPEILSTVQSYLHLLATAQAMPENPAQSDPCCTDQLVREAYLQGFLSSEYLYPKIKIVVKLRDLTPLTADTVQLLADGVYSIRYSTIDDGYVHWGCMDYANLWLLTLTRTDGRWIVTGSESDESDICGYSCGYATENLPEDDVRQAVEAYFQMRADLMAGRDADGSCTTDDLLTESKAFAQCDRSNPITEVRSVPYRYGAATQKGDSLSLQVTEAFRVDGATCCKINRIPHTLTLSRVDGRWIVTGDKYYFNS